MKRENQSQFMKIEIPIAVCNKKRDKGFFGKDCIGVLMAAALILEDSAHRWPNWPIWIEQVDV